MNKAKLMLIIIFSLLLGCSLPKAKPVLKVKTEPANAKLKITQLKETEDYLPIKLYVEDFGSTFGLSEGRKKKLPAQQVYTKISKTGFLEAKLQIFRPKRSALIKLVKFSAEKEQLAKSLVRAGKVFGLPVAYPSYIPKGFKISRAEAQEFADSGITYPGIVIDWSREKQQIGLIVYNTTTVKSMTGFSRGGFFEPKVVRKIKIGKLTAVIEDYSDAYFLFRGKPINIILTFSNIKKNEVLKIVKSIKFPEQ